MILQCYWVILVNIEIIGEYGIYIEFMSEVNIELLLYIPFSLTSAS